MMLLSLRTCARLIWRDLVVFKPTFFDRFLNACIWVALTIVVFQYVFQDLGMQSDYGAFMACANAINWGFFEVMENVARLISDLQGEKSISYDLTLPLPQWMVFSRIALANAFQAMIVSLMILPLSIVILRNDFPLEHVCLGKLLLIFVISNLFYGFFSLWITSLIPNLDSMNNIWMRLIFPLWWLGGYQFSWNTIHTISPFIAKCMLLNPILYTCEGVRAAVFGQQGYLPFWVSFFALVFSTVLVGYIGTRRMLKRLDCVY